MTRKAISFRLPEELLEAVDRARGDVSRTRFVERALERAVGTQAKVSNVQGPNPRETVTRHDHAGDQDYEREPFYE